MNTAMTTEQLTQILDQVFRDVTEQTTGVRLNQGGHLPDRELCTVHIAFNRGFSTGLTLCAGTGLLSRMACNSFQADEITPDDLEEFSKEYFNVFCGKVAGAMFQATIVADHFTPPVFCRGRYEP